jgi:hypothetical protein
MDMLRADLGANAPDYAALIATVEAGIKPALPDPVVIAPVSPRQIRMALTRTGLRSAVEDAVSNGSQDLKDWWEFSTVFERPNAEVVAMGAALGVSPEQLDALWQLAVTL